MFVPVSFRWHRMLFTTFHTLALVFAHIVIAIQFHSTTSNCTFFLVHFYCVRYFGFCFVVFSLLALEVDFSQFHNFSSSFLSIVPKDTNSSASLLVLLWLFTSCTHFQPKLSNATTRNGALLLLQLLKVAGISLSRRAYSAKWRLPAIRAECRKRKASLEKYLRKI